MAQSQGEGTKPIVYLVILRLGIFCEYFFILQLKKQLVCIYLTILMVLKTAYQLILLGLLVIFSINNFVS